jgi:hypothetical protein
MFYSNDSLGRHSTTFIPRKRIDVAATAASLTAIPAGKVVDFITGKLLNDTPEEYVRQNVAMSLVLEYGYNRSQIEVGFKIKLGSGWKWVDLAIFPDDVPHHQENVSVIVETKKQGTKRDDKKEGVRLFWRAPSRRPCLRGGLGNFGRIESDAHGLQPAD